jgi:hypothetical protein
VADNIAGQAKTALDNLDSRLKNYANARPLFKFVGQFLDEEGCASDQHGVYGMGAWVALVEDSDSIRHLPPVKKITDACKGELKRLVGEANELSTWIGAAQRPDGSWGYLTNSKIGCPEITSIVIRTFATHPPLKDKIRASLEYLRGTYEKIDNLFLRLYALNTLLKYDGNGRSAEYPKTIKKVIRVLLNQAFFNPTHFPNPINLDFNDGTQTRYIRLPTDVILLESLQLISGPHMLYARGHPGQRVYAHIIETFKEPPTHDTTGHRLSPFSALHLRRCVNGFLRTKEFSGLVGGLVEKAWGYLVCAWSFGVNLEWNLVSLAICIGGFFASVHFGKTVLVGPFIGAGIKAGLDVCKSLYNAWTRFANE